MKLHHRPLASYLLLWTSCLFYASAANNEVIEIDDEEPHPDPNEENYFGMIYIGRLDDDGKRVGWHTDNGMMNAFY